MRSVLFVDVMPNRSSGSTLLRTHQLWQLGKPYFNDAGITSAVTHSLEHRNSILILNKNTLQEPIPHPLRCGLAGATECVDRIGGDTGAGY